MLVIIYVVIFITEVIVFIGDIGMWLTSHLPIMFNISQFLPMRITNDLIFLWIKVSSVVQTLSEDWHPKVYLKSVFLTVQFRNCIFYTRKYFAVLQQSNFKHLLSSFSIIKQIKQIKQIITYYLAIGYFPGRQLIVSLYIIDVWVVHQVVSLVSKFSVEHPNYLSTFIK
jgi:hypothetical protein